MSLPLSLSKQPIYDHCFSVDRRSVAISKGNDVEIYELTDSSGKPRLLTTLKHHDKPVTALDISIDGKIVTCSQDRNALVWVPTNGDYKPTLVLLRINRAATCVKWSPNGKKFAVGSSARVISVCYFEDENDWWISKHIKRPLKSTILSLDWHPNNVLLACGSTDSHVRVFSAYIKGVDSKPSPTVWGERLPFQTLCLDHNLGSWVHDVKFDPTSNFLGAATHDGSVTFIYPGPGELEVAKISKVRTSFLPFRSLIFLSPSKVVVAGHDCYPIVFEGSAEEGWKHTYSIDDPATKKRNYNENQSALNMFRQMDLKGSSDTASSSLLTIHQNTINVLRPFQGTSGEVTKFSSSGNDGKVVIFDV
ncbi:DEKNAAC101794 [Brettanomyces naardenensis]|uniref:Actin-related protein 2/3 complex subunit n=1 Tax=Brettanomyces naardenensis TaxID=13370 RepID=A0A448YJ77_BRENA|nr:DEKNAAC101794 [Brettanomyces naardenensis]